MQAANARTTRTLRGAQPMSSRHQVAALVSQTAGGVRVSVTSNKDM